MMSGLQPGVRGSAFDRSADTERGAGGAGDVSWVIQVDAPLDKPRAPPFGRSVGFTEMR